MYLLDVEESVDQCTCWMWRRVLTSVLAGCGGEC